MGTRQTQERLGKLKAHQKNCTRHRNKKNEKIYLGA